MKQNDRGNLFGKEIAVGTGSGEIEIKIFFVDFVDEKPVWSNMTFSTSTKVTDEVMISVL